MGMRWNEVGHEDGMVLLKCAADMQHTDWIKKIWANLKELAAVDWMIGIPKPVLMIFAKWFKTVILH